MFEEEIPETIRIVGVGGSGCNTVSRLMESMDISKYKGKIDCIGVNTDAPALDRANIPHKQVLGYKMTKGQGAGARPLVGKIAAEESIDDVLKLIGKPTLTILTCGLGGGTGTGALPAIANALRKKYPDMLIINMVTLPFISEGLTRVENARLGLREAYELADMTVVNSNDVLSQLVPNLPTLTAFRVMDGVLSGMIKGLVDLMSTVGVINVDFADFRTAVRDAGFGYIGFGIGDTPVKAAKNAFENRLLDVELDHAKSMILHMQAPRNIKLEDARKATVWLNKYEIENIIYGLRLYDIPIPKAMIVAGGVKSGLVTQMCGSPIQL